MLSSFRPLLPFVEEQLLGRRGDTGNDERKDQQSLPIPCPTSSSRHPSFRSSSFSHVSDQRIFANRSGNDQIVKIAGRTPAKRGIDRIGTAQMAASNLAALKGPAAGLTAIPASLGRAEMQATQEPEHENNN
jgi:hypothetical protein